MKKILKKSLAVFLCVLFALTASAVTAFATGATDYTIVSPYETVNWDTWGTYKANLHTHTNASDGDPSITEMVEYYYDHDYDILSITDHGVVNERWTAERRTYPLFNAFADFEPMSAEDYERITTGSDRGGRGMVDVVGGIETNMAVISKTHVNGFFTTYGNGVWGKENDYKTAAVEIAKTGGVSVLNHIGDWTDTEDYPERSHWGTYIAYFADIFTSVPSCLGLEIVNSNDRVTKADRALWDELLEVVIPTGRTILGFSNDDSEELTDCFRSFEYFMLPENNLENVRTAMETGTFFACSIHDKTDPDNILEGNGEVPIVTRIDVDNDANSIEVSLDPTRDCSSIEWIANGEVISNDLKIDLNDYENQLGCYVRFKLTGEGGVTYSQPFVLEYEGRVDKAAPDYSWLTDNVLFKLFASFYHSIPFSVIAIVIEKVVEKIIYYINA